MDEDIHHERRTEFSPMLGWRDVEIVDGRHDKAPEHQL
jgi:hypothetical protein